MESASIFHLYGKSIMKKQLTLSIPKPCSEKWDNFIPASNGRFCTSCNKIVTDFTQMSDHEIIEFFRDMPAHACGRFRPDQLKIYSTKPLLTPPRPQFVKSRVFEFGTVADA
jgi:hypothetical protein